MKLAQRTAVAVAVATLSACEASHSLTLLEPSDIRSDARASVVQQQPTCEGVPATLWAGMPVEAIPEGATITQRQHVAGYEIRGTQKRDVIVGSDGADRLRGQDGNDLICAEDGDLVWGGPGNDHIVAAGTVTARSGPGNDRIIGGAGRQRMHGGPGNDVLDAGDGDDVMLGGPDNDVLRGGPGADFFGGCADTDIAQDFDVTLDWFNGTVEVGIPAGAVVGDVPHDDQGGCGDEGEDDDCGGDDHEDGGCEDGSHG